jgi:hypothetical protein
VVRGLIVAAGAAAILGSSPMAAQDKQGEPDAGIPASALPPEGMCRLWLKDVPEKHQPAPTDCATAIRTRPRDAVLLLGEPTKNAKLPVRRPVTTSRPPSNELFGRSGSSSLNALERLQAQNRPPTQGAATRSVTTAPASATAPAQAPAAAVKAEPKPAAIKPPQ